jgi:quinolinate synthase
MINLDEIRKKLLTAHRYAESEVNVIMPKLAEIEQIRKEKGAVILAHYYQIPPIQLIADKSGDSLALAIYAQNMGGNSGLVVSSAVYFMAEMIKLLSPNKKIVIPDTKASCSIAEGMNVQTVRRIRSNYPSAAIVAYINTTAEVKSEVDVVCTSSNAETIVKNVEGDQVILLPDYFFAKNILHNLEGEQKNRKYLAYKGIENGNIILEDVFNNKEETIPAESTELPTLSDGTCMVHNKFTPFDIYEYRRRGRIDAVLAHPEVRPSVAKMADVVGGTGKMIDYLKSHQQARKILFITECDMAAPLREAFPDRDFFTPCRFCDYMQRNNLDNLLNSLKNEVHEVRLDPKIECGAKRSLERMFELMDVKK